MRKDGHVPSAKPPVTTPAPKYGPTEIYGRCEFEACRATARATCATCDGHFCLTHAEHKAHDGD
jgi:hypothetical protein